MADVNSQVALGINAPDPQGGLKSISGILGIGQQGLAIRSKEVGIEQQKQQLQQQQIETLRQQSLQNFFQNWDPSQHDGPDGTTDLDSARQSDAYKSAGLAKPDIDLKLSQIKAAQLANKQSLTTLNGDNLGQLGRMAQSLSADDDVKAGGPAGIQKVKNAFDSFSKLGPDAARVAQIYSPMTQHAPPGKLVNGVMALAAQAQDVSAQQAQTNPVPTTFDTGAQIMPATINRATGVPTLTGQRLNKVTPPQVTTTPAGLVSVAAGGRGAAVIPSTTPNANPSQAVAHNVTTMAGDDTGRYAQVSQEGTNAQTGAQLADQVAQLAGQVRTGQLTKEWADRLTVLRQQDPKITDRQMLAKYAAQLKTLATSTATTDASRSQIDEGMPSPETMDPAATKQAANYVGGVFRMRGARQQFADQYAKTNGNTVGIRGADDAFMSAADPTLFAYKALPAGAERQEFLKAHGLTTPAKIQEFRERMNQVNHFSGGQ